MPGNDLVLAVAQRNDDKVLKNFSGDFDCRFQFPELSSDGTRSKTLNFS